MYEPEKGADGGGMESLLHQAPIGVVVTTGGVGDPVVWNPRIEEIWGRSFVTGATPGEGSWTGFRRDGSRYAPRDWPLWRSLATGERVDAEEIAIIRGDGSTGLVRLSSGPVRNHGGHAGAMMTVVDVSERLRSELSRQILSETTAVLSSTLEYEETLRNVARLAVPTLADWCAVDLVSKNGEVQRLVVEHVDRRKKRVAEELSVTYGMESDRGVSAVLRSCRAALIPEPSETDLLGRELDDRYRALFRRLGLRSAMIAPLVARGRPLGAIIFVTGESGRRFGEEDLALAEELAFRAAVAIDNARLYHESQAANRAKADFLAVISHELRTPLTAILGYAELLNLGIPDPITESQQEHVERIDLSARHLLQVIEEILSVVTLESGASPVERRPVSCNDLLRTASVIIEPLARAKGLELRTELDDDAMEVNTDAHKLIQALLNLLTNAVKFTDAGTVSLGIRPSRNHVEFVVRDTGVGLGDAERERVFDAFWQAEQPITRRAGGAGLGLTVTRRIAEILGGEILIDSQPQSGSAFTLRLPLGLAHSD